LEKQVLHIIRDEYPVPFDASSTKILAIGERPTVTPETVHPKCMGTLNEVRQAVDRLHEFQLIERVYLCDPREFAQQHTGAGHIIRLVVGGPPGGPHGQYIFQITDHGQKIIDTFLPERLKRAWWKFAEERLLLALTLLVTAFCTWFLTRLGLRN
jgi:hypothetical protein